MNKYDERMSELGAYYVGKGEPSPLDAQDIRRVEERLGRQLPEDYAAFLADYGCYGFDQYVAFPYLAEYPHGAEGILNVCFGIAPGSAYDLFYNYETFAGRVPANLLPIADDPGSNLICLALGGGDRGRVYFWDRTSEAVYLIGNSFDEFMRALRLMEDE